LQKVNNTLLNYAYSSEACKVYTTMTVTADVVKSLRAVVGLDNVLTDVEDLYVYSFEHIFRKQQYPTVKAIAKTQSQNQINKIQKLAKEQNFTTILRSKGNKKPVNSEIVLIDDLKPQEETTAKEVSENIEEIHRAGHGTFRNFALALQTIFQTKLSSRCQECQSCSGYCTVAPSFNHTETWSSKGRTLLMKALAEGQLSPSKKLVDILYTCSTCGLCFAQCLQDLEIDKAVRATRHQLVEKGLTPQLFVQTAKNIAETGDPSGTSKSRRLQWTKTLPLKRNLPQKAEVLYWVGCTVATRTPNTARAVANILNHADVEFTMLGEKEGCCNYVLLAAGLWNEAKNNALTLLERVKATNAEILVTPCAGCYYTFAQLYPQVLDVRMPLEVLHTSQLVEQLIWKGTIEPKELNVKVTYHDPCSLGRHCGVYEPPRKVLKAIPKLKLVETPLSRSRARCCGAGGGLWSYNNEVSMNSASTRLIEDVAPLDIDLMTTCCPACHMNLRYTAAKKSISVEIYDVMEVVERSVFS